MSEAEAPKIEFPCPDYPVKIMGESGPDYHEFVLTVVERHAPGFDQTRITIRESSKGTFQSITVFITATGEPQLKSLHQDLISSSKTKMVL